MRRQDRKGASGSGGTPPHAVTWVAGGLLVDSVVWLALVQVQVVRDNPLISPVLVAVGLCWSHAFVTPQLVWQQPTRIVDRLAAIGFGLVMAALSVLFGGLGGLAVGIPTIFTGAILGSLAGGALTGVVAARLMRVLPATRGMISLKRGALGGVLGPNILLWAMVNNPVGLVDGLAWLRWFGATLAAGVVASVATVPRWRSPWPSGRLVLGLAAGVALLVAAPAWVLWHRPEPVEQPAVQLGQASGGSGWTGGPSSIWHGLAG